MCEHMLAQVREGKVPKLDEIIRGETKNTNIVPIAEPPMTSVAAFFSTCHINTANEVCTRKCALLYRDPFGNNCRDE